LKTISTSINTPLSGYDVVSLIPERQALRRRDLIAILGGAAAVNEARAHAQQTRPVIGFLNATSANEFTHVVDTFRRCLNEIR
jgi:hypothetical protein